MIKTVREKLMLHSDFISYSYKTFLSWSVLLYIWELTWGNRRGGNSIRGGPDLRIHGPHASLRRAWAFEFGRSHFTSEWRHCDLIHIFEKSVFNFLELWIIPSLDRIPEYSRHSGADDVLLYIRKSIIRCEKLKHGPTLFSVFGVH